MASHEFRTPLTSVLTSTELIQRYYKKWDHEKIDRHLDRIIGSVVNLTRLMDDVITINRAESGKLKLNKTETNIRQLCDKIIEEASFTAAARQNVIFSYKCDSDMCIIDPRQTEVILQNLISNAIKYSPAGGKIELEVNIDASFLYLTIKDQGIGIPQEDMARLFEPFHRALNVDTIEGTGLGLSIVKNAVDLHGGTINVASELGKGTSFFVKLPVG